MAAAVTSVEALNKLTNTAEKLISDLLSLLESLKKQSEDAYDADKSAIDSIGLAHDSASLIKSHSTKLSLLIINEPFSPTAISKVLQELLAGPVPMIASAASACEGSRYTVPFSQELQFRCKRVLEGLRDLIHTVPQDGKVLPQAQRDRSADGRGSMLTTGILWSACDDVVKLKALGVPGLLSQKLDQYRDTIEDIKQELKEWKEENEGVDSDDDEDDNEPEFDVDEDDPQAMLDDLLSSFKIPKHRTDIRNQLPPCIARFGLMIILYKAITKRRIKSLSMLPSKEPSDIAKRVNDVWPLLKGLPDSFGELVAAFYKLDVTLIESTREACFDDASTVADILKRPWEGESDEFSGWVEKFQVQIKKAPAT